MARPEPEPENPYAPPRPAGPLPAAVTRPQPDVLSVTFRLSAEDLRGVPAGSWARPLVVAAVTLAGVALLLPLWQAGGRGGGLLSELLTLVCIVILPTALVAVLIAMPWRRARSRGDVPFLTTVELSPRGLLVREEGLLEWSRPWSSVAEVERAGLLLHFDVRQYDLVARRFVEVPGLIVPLRAFATEAEAAAFLDAARAWRAEAGPPGD